MAMLVYTNNCAPAQSGYRGDHRRRTVGLRWPLTIIAALMACVSKIAGLFMLSDSSIDIVRNGPALALLILTGAAMTLAVVAVNTYRWQ